MDVSAVFQKYYDKLMLYNPQWCDKNVTDNFIKQKNIDAFNLSKQFADSNLHNERSSGPEIPFLLTRSDKFGRHLVTKRNVKKGEIIMIERPAILAPLVATPLSKASSVCIVCLKLVNDNTCTECGFYLCSDHLKQELQSHSELCHYLQKLQLADDQQSLRKLKSANFKEQMALKAPTEQDRNNLPQIIETAVISFLRSQKTTILNNYLFLAVLLTIMLEKVNFDLYSVIVELQGNLDETTRQYKANQNRVVEPLQEKLKLENPSKFLHKLAAIWDTNAFEVNVQPDTKCQGLYPAASLLTHSCRANCEQYFVPITGTLILRAVQDIDKNSVLTICYTDPLWPCHIRRDHLRVTKSFLCFCDRCREPTENGTHMSSIICLNDCNGYLLWKDLSKNEVGCSKCEAEFELKQV